MGSILVSEIKNALRQISNKTPEKERITTKMLKSAGEQLEKVDFNICLKEEKIPTVKGLEVEFHLAPQKR